MHIFFFFMLPLALHSEGQYWIELGRHCCVSADHACGSTVKCWYLTGTCQCTDTPSAYCQYISLLSQFFPWRHASSSQCTWSLSIFREFYSEYSVMGQRVLCIYFYGDSINCNSFLISSFPFVRYSCHLYAGIRRISWCGMHCCLTVLIQHLTKFDCWHTHAKDGCILHLIYRNNNSDRELFFITLLSFFILMHRHVCHTTLSLIKPNYEQFYRHTES